MKLETYKEVYRNPITHIAVPDEFKMGNFEVFFVPIMDNELPIHNSQKIIKNMPNPLLAGSVTIIDDVTPLENDWELD